MFIIFHCYFIAEDHLEYQSSESGTYRTEESSVDTDSQGDSEFDPGEGCEVDPNDPNATALAAAKKGNVLFTPEDILRMFPANENEQNKLEIEEEIRKLKVSSEKSVAEATEEMKKDFQLRMMDAVNEIRSLREALTGIPCAPMSTESEKGNNLSNEKMKRLASKKSFANTSGGDLNNGTRSFSSFFSFAKYCETLSNITISLFKPDARPSKKDSFHVSRKSSRMKMDTMSGVASTTSIAHNMAVKGRRGKDGVSRHNSAQSLNGRTHSNNSLKDGLTHSRKSSRSPVPPEGADSTSTSPDKLEIVVDINESSSAQDSSNSVMSPVPLYPTKLLPKWPPPPTRKFYILFVRNVGNIAGLAGWLSMVSEKATLVISFRLLLYLLVLFFHCLFFRILTAPTPSKPVVIPRDTGTAAEAEVQQMKSELQSLQGDMSEIKKMLGSILGKM